MTKLRNRSITVFGISGDGVQVHQAFARSERLNFSLLADTNKETTRAYGVLGTNGLPRRVTFIIGPDGTIRAIDGNVDAQFAKPGGTLVSRHGENLALLLSDWKAQVGMRVPNFFLPNYSGETVSPLASGKKAAVVVFLGSRCPLSRAHAAMLRELATNPVYKDVAFMGVAAGSDEDPSAIKKFADSTQLRFPIARDPYNEVTDRFGAKQTPSAWVLDGKGVVRYSGALMEDPAHASGGNYVREALNALLMGRPAPVTETPVRGTAIVRSVVGTTVRPK